MSFLSRKSWRKYLKMKNACWILLCVGIFIQMFLVLKCSLIFVYFKVDNVFLEHFCLWVDEVIGPILRHAENIQKFPLCISKGRINRLWIKCNFEMKKLNLDIKKQAHDLCTTVYQIKGYIKGKTLLPFPEVRMDQCISIILILFCIVEYSNNWRWREKDEKLNR